jgi:hypothetical protein
MDQAARIPVIGEIASFASADAVPLDVHWARGRKRGRGRGIERDTAEWGSNKSSDTAEWGSNKLCRHCRVGHSADTAEWGSNK